MIRPPSLDLAAPLSLGCVGCPRLESCGGMYSPNGGWGCSERWPELETDPEPDVLHARDRNFPQRVAEVGGFGFGDLDPLLSPTELPPYISGIDHGSYFEVRDTKQLGWAAVHLRKIFTFGYGGWRPCFSGPTELRRTLGIPGRTRLVLSCIDQDHFIEPMWAHLYEAGFSSYIRSLGFEAVVAPNFSVFDNEPRSQHQLNRKRSAIVAEELSRFNIPVVLYCHGNAPADWSFWRDVLIARPTIRFIAKEFQTGLASPARARACLRAFASLQEEIGRPLHLVAFGAVRHRQYIAERFRSWTIVAFNPFVLATKHRELVYTGTGFRQQLSQERRGLLFSRSDRLLRDHCMDLASADLSQLTLSFRPHTPAAAPSVSATGVAAPRRSGRCGPRAPRQARRPGP